MYLGLNIKEYTVREIDPNDSWDIGDSDGYVTGVVETAYKDFNGIETDLTRPFYVVYAQYTEGCTFGFNFAAQILDVFKDEESALGLRDAASEAKGFYFGYNDKEYHCSWNGYFERLKSIDIERVV